MTIRPLPDFLTAGDAALGLGQRSCDPPVFAHMGKTHPRPLPPLPARTSTDQPSSDAHAHLAWHWHVQAGRIGGG